MTFSTARLSVIALSQRGLNARETAGFWLQVQMADGRTAYVLGDTIEAVAVNEDALDAPSKAGFVTRFFAPSKSPGLGAVAAKLAAPAPAMAKDMSAAVAARR